MPNGRSYNQPGSVYRQRVLRLDPNRLQASALARRKQAVVIEDLAVGGMLKSRRFSRGLADQALASLRRQLEYKCPTTGAGCWWRPATSRVASAVRIAAGSGWGCR
jgi:hypothetical protein